MHHPNILASNELHHLSYKLGFKMLLSGDGADELFCGYKWHLINSDMLKKLNIKKKLNFLSYAPTAQLYKCLNLNIKPINKEICNEIKNISLANNMIFLGQKIYL